MNVLEIAAQKHHTVLNFLVAKSVKFLWVYIMMHARYFLKFKIFKYDVFKILKTHIKPDCYLFYFKIKSSLVTCVGRKLARHTLAWSRLASLSINFTVSPQHCNYNIDSRHVSEACLIVLKISFQQGENSSCLTLTIL